MDRKNIKRLRGGSFNLKYGRDPHRVLWEIRQLFDKHRLSFLCVQEVNDYIAIIRASNDFVFIPTNEVSESGIIVRRGISISKKSKHVYGDGWTTVRGGHFPAAEQHQALLAGWLFVRSCHLPTPTFWHDGRVRTPRERMDDLVLTSRGMARYLLPPSFWRARLVAGDMNEPPSTLGAFSPAWIARTARAHLAFPKSREGHGRIDYVLFKGCRVTRIWKDTEISELSDHEPVIFIVEKGRRP